MTYFDSKGRSLIIRDFTLIDDFKAFRRGKCRYIVAYTYNINSIIHSRPYWGTTFKASSKSAMISLIDSIPTDTYTSEKCIRIIKMEKYQWRN